MGRKQSEKLIHTYLSHIREGDFTEKIATKLGRHPSVVSRALRRLAKDGYLKRTNTYPAFYDLTPIGKAYLVRRNNARTSLPVRYAKLPFFSKSVNFHDFKVKLPIIARGEKIPGARSVPLNNWVRDYYKVDLPVKLTLEVTTKNVILHFIETALPRNARFYTELYRWYILGTYGAINFLQKHGYTVDVWSAEVISQHIANKTSKAVDAAVPDGSVTSVNLNRPASTLTGQARHEAEAWIDKSKHRDGNRSAEVESNDLQYEEKILRMPETVHNLNEREVIFMDALGNYTKQIKGHLAVMRKMGRTLDNIDKTISLLRREG